VKCATPESPFTNCPCSFDPAKHAIPFAKGIPLKLLAVCACHLARRSTFDDELNNRHAAPFEADPRSESESTAEVAPPNPFRCKRSTWQLFPHGTHLPHTTTDRQGPLPPPPALPGTAEALSSLAGVAPPISGRKGTMGARERSWDAN
jgi:hypothetical protein